MLSKEEIEMFENQIKLIKEAKEILQEANEETFICPNCGETYSLEEKGTSELALNDGVCIYCMEDYGR